MFGQRADLNHRHQGRVQLLEEMPRNRQLLLDHLRSGRPLPPHDRLQQVGRDSLSIVRQRSEGMFSSNADLFCGG
jgi:hypothetical protein